MKKMFSGADGKKVIILVAIGILGILLMLLGSFSGGKKSKTQNLSTGFDETEAYISETENKIRNITEQITGSGKTCVVVTVKSGVESVYAYDEKTASGSESKSHITVKNSSGDGEPVLVKRIYPEIAGVSIACEGGDSAEIRAKLINAVSTALGLSSNRICIVGTK